ncbi:MAG: glycosyltransferase family 39 protein, partial [Patescibacteria group bacterium]
MKRFSKLFLFIFAFFAFSMLLHLGRDLLFDWDECLYGQYAKEMVQSGHFLTNIWNGYIDLQKPPLYSWLLQLPLLFGRNEFTLRILTVFGALGIITSTYLFAKKYFSEFVAILSVLILLCAELFVIYSTKMTTDMLYTLFIFLGVWSWLHSGQKGVSRSKIYVLCSGILFGLA